MLKITIMVFIYLFIVALNFFMMFTCLQRKMLDKCEDSDTIKYHIFYSMLLSVFGPISLIGIFIGTVLSGYGIKFWVGEREHPNNKWYYKWQAIIQRQHMMRPSCDDDDDYTGKDKGRYSSIW